MGYVSYNVGFKSGFYNTISYSAPVVQPETLDATEVGLKTEFFDRALRLNVAGYYYKYKDLQLPESEAGSTNYYNAGAATLKGADLDFAVIPVRNLTFQGGISYEHGRYTSFPNAVGYVPNPAGGNTVVSFDATGYPTAQTPQWTENITGNYKFYLPNGTLQPSLIFTHNSGYCWSAADCRVQQPAYSVVNGTLAWNAPNERWGVSLWAKNIFNREYYRWENEQEPNYEFLPAAPRTYGITFQSKF
jgi:iron complex outermembrane receptor protein